MSKCLTCGILIKEDNGFRCFKYGTDLNTQEIERERDCPYFAEPLFDDGELLSAAQLILLKEEDLKRRKMQGPV